MHASLKHSKQKEKLSIYRVMWRGRFFSYVSVCEQKILQVHSDA